MDYMGGSGSDTDGTSTNTSQTSLRNEPWGPFNTKDPGPWVFRLHRENLIQGVVNEHHGPVSTSDHGESGPELWRSDKSFRISLPELQRMRLRKLQCILVRQVNQMRWTDVEPEDWEDTLQKYTQTLRDYDYMSKRSEQPRDPFLVTGERQVDRYVLSQIIGNRYNELPDDDKKEKLVEPWEPNGGDSNPIVLPRPLAVQKMWWVAFGGRVLIAVLGGSFLIAPMWIMILHKTVYTGLIGTTVFVTAFGFVMAGALDQKMDVLSSTAAYAAVLVVLVGLKTS